MGENFVWAIYVLITCSVIHVSTAASKGGDLIENRIENTFSSQHYGTENYASVTVHHNTTENQTSISTLGTTVGPHHTTENQTNISTQGTAKTSDTSSKRPTTASTVLPVTFETTTLPNSTVAPQSNSTDIPMYVGFLVAGVAVLFYGSNFAPVKKFETGDGMFFQWVMCSAVLCVGIVVQIIRGTKNFYPIVMVGGLMWETGNICVVPIIKTIGMGLGLCIWGMTNLLSGWATGRFGFFGLEESTPHNPTLNLIGVIVAVSSSIVFAFVKNEVTPIEEYSEKEPLLNQSGQDYSSQGSESLYNSSTNNHDVLLFNQKRRGSSSINRENAIPEADETFIDRLSPGNKRILGLILSVVSGFLYGQMFTPAIYMQQQEGHSKNALDYVFACFCGIYLTSTLYFVIYILFMKNKPKVYKKCIFPGIVSGLMWGIATSCWFVANKVLSEPVAFPIVTTGPSIIASLWGIFAFREIKGTRNIGILVLGFVFVIVGSVLTGLST